MPRQFEHAPDDEAPTSGISDALRDRIDATQAQLAAAESAAASLRTVYRDPAAAAGPC